MNKIVYKIGQKITLPSHGRIIPEQRATVLSLPKNGCIMVRIDESDRIPGDVDGLTEVGVNMATGKIEF